MQSTGSSPGRTTPTPSGRSSVASTRNEWTKAREIADAAARHEVPFFGQTFHFGPDIAWHKDPVTGVEWPRLYHRDVPVEGGNRGFGDVKYVWELNRHQFFVDLAKIAFLDRSRPHADSLHAILRSWHAAVPYATGVPWACALEPAFRAWSWMWSYRMVLASGLLDEETHLLWLTGLYDHGRFLYRHLERYASPYNHLVGEASALFALGLLLRDCEEADVWIGRAREILESTLGGQFHRDGGTVEQSTFYHHATLGFYILSAILGRRGGVALSRDVDGAIVRGLEFSTSLEQPDGRVPRIGGADDGKPIRLEHLPFWDFRPYQAIGAVEHERPDFKFAARRFWEDALWVLGTEGLTRFERLGSAEPARVVSFPATGYFVARSDWTSEADYLCFDCGEQAAGLRKDDVPSAAHGHADCLSVIVALGGRPVLVDPGFYCYNGEAAWEVHFRKTKAHNTLTVDGRDQAKHLSKMAWVRTYTPRFEDGRAEKVGWARGSHDGFSDGGAGVIHRRLVWLRPGGYLLILDELNGSPGHTARAGFQFAPGDLALDGEDVARFSDRFELAWACSVPATATIVSGEDGPDGGWVAPSLGVRERAPRLQIDFQMSDARVFLVSVVSDRERGPGRERRATFAAIGAGDRRDGTGVRVTGHGWVDRALAGPGGVVIGDDVLETDAALGLMRLSTEGLQPELHHIGGTFVRARESREQGARRLDGGVGAP